MPKKTKAKASIPAESESALAVKEKDKKITDIQQIKTAPDDTVAASHREDSKGDVVICIHYAKSGNCRFGDKCRYAHIEDSAIDPTTFENSIKRTRCVF